MTLLKVLAAGALGLLLTACGASYQTRGGATVSVGVAAPEPVYVAPRPYWRPRPYWHRRHW